MTLRLRRHEFADDHKLMMAIVNRTPDSFFDQGATWAEDKAFERVAAVVEQGAEIVDIGGIKAAPGVEISAAEEKARVVDFVARVRETAAPDGSLQSLEQAGWGVHVLRRTTSGPYSLPARIEMSTTGLRVRLVVADWRVGP